ncbi:uncharacterized protein [Coffea arabica]|uniref:RNase H type-1 domain-containing protein n=1 Tax=Coffea arabica TaxID=13443 RepID=A0ABM4WPE9_COFAR
MEAKAGDSGVWRSLLSSKELLQRGIRKTVGDGRNINIWEDNWIPDMENGRIRTRKPQHCQLKSVHELMKDGRWNEDLMSTYFEEEDCSKIKKIPISERGAKDRLVWVFSSAGQYTVKSGYAVAKDMQKTKERPDHQRGSSSRNTEESGAWKFLWSLKEWQEYAEVVNEGDGPKKDGKGEAYGEGKWSPPPQHFICLNTDAALRQKDGKIGWGVVARCSSGKMIGAWAGSEQRFGDPAVEEARAIRKAMTIAMKNGWKDIVIQSDCKIVIEKIKLGRLEDPRACAVLFDILQLRKEFRNCSFSFIRRDGNVVSHSLARFALNLVADIAWRISFPSWLLQLANNDVGAVAPSDVNTL